MGDPTAHRLLRTRAWPALLALALIAAGCSSGGGTGTNDSATTATHERVRVVSQNLLHGIACPADSNRCDLPGRVALFTQQLEDQRCPELVSVQEANELTVSLLRSEAEKICDGSYTIVWDDDPGLDREVVLTTLPVLGSHRTRLAGPLRTALWVRVSADVGVVDFVSSHLASTSDDRPCDRATCPPPCEINEMVNACQARQLASLADETAAPDSVVIVGGDLNAKPGEPAITSLVDAGLVDTHLAAGNPECDAKTGEQCTSGRADDALTDLTDPASRQSERIDYLFVGGSRKCSAVQPTGLFNGGPADPSAGGLIFPADHTAVAATIDCTTTEAQLAAALTATVTSAPTTTDATPTQVAPETLEAITEAFSTLFDGDVTDADRKLAALEDGEVLRPFFLASFEAQKAIAARVRVRLDDVTLVDSSHANVTYTLLLDGAAVLDHLPGTAVQRDGTWLVTRRTYCDVSTQGATEIPAPCQ